MVVVSFYCRILFYQLHLFSIALVDCDIMQTSIFLTSKYTFKMKCAFHYTRIPLGSSKKFEGRFGTSFEAFKCPKSLTYTVRILNNSQILMLRILLNAQRTGRTSPRPVFRRRTSYDAYEVI